MKTREMIIFGRNLDQKEYSGGIKYFDFLNIEQINELLQIGALNLDDQQNDSPSIGEIIEFIKANSRFVVHGYVVSESRPDSRISFEGVTLEGESTEQERKAFVEMFRHADEFTFDNDCLNAWYD